MSGVSGPRFRGRALRAIVFDLDGTLIDSTADIRHALNSMLSAYNRSALDHVAVSRMVGDGIPKLVERGLAATGGVPSAAVLREAINVCLAAYEARPAVETRPFPGVAEALQVFREAGLGLAVCSNKTEKLSRLILESLGLAGFFEAIVGGDSLDRRKPDPAPVRACLAALGVTADEALFVGDGPNDVLAARAAGLPVVLVESECGQVPAQDLGADRVFPNMTALRGSIFDANP